MNINVNDLPGNSNMQKAQDIREVRRNEDDVTKPSKAVAKGHIRKTSPATRISDVFVAEDIKSVANHVFSNLIVPRFKVLIVDAISSAARAFFLGESVIDGSAARQSGSGYTPYNSIYGGVKTTVKTSSSSGYGFQLNETIEFDTYGDAKLVLDKMDEMLMDAGEVSISDMYAAADRSCPYTYEYYGWKNISSAKIVLDSSGKYWIKMPKPISLKRN